MNGPAGTVVADRIVTPGIVSAARFAHAVPLPAAGVAVSARMGVAATASARANCRRIMAAIIRLHSGHVPTNLSRGRRAGHCRSSRLYGVVNTTLPETL